MKQPTLAELLEEACWLEWRSRIPEPYYATELVTSEQTRAEFLHGARLLRLDKLQRAGDGQYGPTPVQLAIADMLGAGRFLNAVLEPRRATKTTALEATIIGRCGLRDDYTAGWTLATTGLKAGERFRRDIVAPLVRLYPNPKTRPFNINVGKGTEHIEWRSNGSFFGVYAPGGDAFRSGGFDLGWVDEGGEADVELGTDITVTLLPTMDTKIGAQFIVSGTAAAYTIGNLLHDTLEDPTAGVMRHSAPPTTDPEELEDWEPSEQHPRARVRELIELYHPGVGYTTPLEAVERNFHKFRASAPERFEREYLGIFGTEGAGAQIITPAWWERCARDGTLPAVPANFTLALAIHPDGLWASVGVAWHLEPEEDLVSTALALDGQQILEQPTRAAIGILHWQAGTKGLATKVLTLARKHRVGIIYDQASQAAGVEIEILSRAAPRPTLTPATTIDVRRAATKTLKLLEQGQLMHFRQQQQLQSAAEIAVKRAIGGYGGFGFGRPKGDPAADITPLEACSLALQFLDEQPTKTDVANALHFG